MSEEQRFKLENELLMTKSKAQMINLYLDKLDKLHQKENIIKEVRKYIEPLVKLDNDIMLKGIILKPVLEILDKDNK